MKPAWISHDTILSYDKKDIVPKGSFVHVIDSNEGWTYIAWKSKRGQVPMSAISYTEVNPDPIFHKKHFPKDKTLFDL